ncbi:hypothetical protein GTP55_25820 [Duganella sp. FT109W]|uniref:Uncharacterized protein n=1 Tax=Duganella margarita TaxID=2692170 RepID=A0ABW9WNG9_9BURK|nr:hypothetical protein [Duganella margarita]MYN42766.1 hypothetical protein [Duganella margarita]
MSTSDPGIENDVSKTEQQEAPITKPIAASVNHMQAWMIQAPNRAAAENGHTNTRNIHATIDDSTEIYSRTSHKALAKPIHTWRMIIAP